MDIFNSRYWKLVSTLQKIIGFWPFRSMWKNYIPWMYVYIFTFSFMISMGVRLYNELGVNKAIVIENIVGEAYLTIAFFKLTLNIIAAKEHVNDNNTIVANLKYIYSEIAKDWKLIVDKAELQVMQKYTEDGRKSITLYSGFILTGVSMFLIMPITSPLLDYIIPLENASRPKALPYYAEYGIDQEKYYYPLMTQAIFGGIGTVTVIVTFDLGFIMIVQHVVALFALVKFRLQKIEEISEAMDKRIVDYVKGDSRAYNQAFSAIKLHKTVIDYVNLVEDCYSNGWLIIHFLNVLMVGGGYFVILMKHRAEEILRYTVVVIAQLIHFYFTFLPGQKIINSSLDVFDACYACKWYNLSERTKNLIKVMMIRSLRRCELTGGKVIILCMDTYCSLMKTGLSIFTFVNTQK